MTRDEMQKAFSDYLACQDGYGAGAISRREHNLAGACFAAMCRGGFKPMCARDAAILAGLAAQVEGRPAA